MQPLLQAMGGAGVLANAIMFMRPDGSYVTLEKGPIEATLADRPYFPALMGGEAIEGVLVISRSTGRRSIVVAQPVRRQGQVIGALGISLSVDQLSHELDEDMRLPQGIVFYALDAHGQTALHRDPTLMFQFPADIGDPSLRSAVTQMLSTDQGTVHYQFRGVHKTVIYEKSPALGWVFALGFPETPAGAPR
jgi:C4-dicarboxylate-specific signal transduction histidine kinase